MLISALSSLVLSASIYFIISTTRSFDWLLSSKLIYDDSYMVKNLDERYPYLKLNNSSYFGPRDYFNFSNVFKPNNDYFKRINLEEHLYDELRAMEIGASIATMDQWHYSDKEDLIRSGGPEANEKKCFRELAEIQVLLDKVSNNSSLLFERNSLNNIQFLRYIDSWARPPSETYHGHSYWVGSHRACQLIELELPSTSIGNTTTKFRYCWTKLRAKDWPDVDEMIPPTSFRAGICLPKSCDTIAANKRLKEIHKMLLFNFAPLHRDRFNKLINVYCLPEQTGLGFAGKLFIKIIITWLALVFGVSIFVAFKGSPIPGALNCLSLQENFQRFNESAEKSITQDDQQQQNQINLRPLNLVRLFASILICFGHCICASGWVFNTSTFNILQSKSLPFQLGASLFKTLDLYLVISGLLSSYIIMKRFSGERRNLLLNPIIHLKIILSRYFRWAPMLILVLAFMKAIYPHLSDGPIWDYGTYKYSMQGQCKRSSWWHILGFPIVFNLVDGNSYLSECLPISWYLIADLKISFVLPLIVYIMTSKRKANKWLLTTVLLTLSALSQYKDLSMQELIYFKQFFHYGQLVGINILNLTFGEPGYFSAINRLHAVVFGLLAGVQLHQYETARTFKGDVKLTVELDETHNQMITLPTKLIKEESNNNRKWPFWMNGPFFWAAILWEIYDFFAPILVQRNYLLDGKTPSEETIKLVMVLKPRLDAFIFSIILLRFVSDLSPKLMRNSSTLYNLGKLSYCVFLIHTIIISYVCSANENSRPDSFSLEVLMLSMFTLCTSFLLSFPLYLLVESPIAQLLSHYSKTLLPPSSVNPRLDATKIGFKRKIAKNKRQQYNADADAAADDDDNDDDGGGMEKTKM